MLNIIESFLVDIGIAVNPETLKQSEKDLNKNKQNVQKSAADIDKANKGNADTHKKASDEIKKNNESVGKSNLVLSKEFVAGVTAMGAALTGWVMGIQAVAKEYEGLYYAQKRGVGEGADIKAFGSSISKMGGDADDATQSLEALAQKMRQNPGEEGLLQSIGVQTRDAKGQLKGVAEMMPDLADQFAKMPYYMAAQYAQAMGISERTMMAMRSNPAEFRKHQDEYRAQLKAMGLDVNQAEQASKDFDNSLRGVQEQFQIAGSILAIKVMPVLNRITDWMQKNPKTVQAIAVGLAALSAAAIGLGVAMGVASLATTAFTLAASPVLWLVMAIVAIIGALIAAYAKWSGDIGISFDWKGLSKLIHAAGDEVNYVSQKILELLGNYKSWAEAKQDFLKGLHGESDPTANMTDEQKAEYYRETKAGNRQTYTRALTDEERGKYSLQESHATDYIIAKNILIAKQKAAIKVLEAIPTESNLQSAKEQRAKLAQLEHDLEGDIKRRDEAREILKRGTMTVTNDYASNQPSQEPQGAGYRAGKFIRSAGRGIKSLFDAVGSGEGGYNSVNYGSARGYKSGKENLTAMTFGEILERQKNKEFNAVGKGQWIRGTLIEDMKKAGLNEKSIFTEENQNKLFYAGLPDVVKLFIAGKASISQAQDAMAKKWASVGVSQNMSVKDKFGTRFIKQGQSYYEGVANNHANAKTTRNVVEMLKRNSYPLGVNPSNLSGAQTNNVSYTNNITVNGVSDASEAARLTGSAVAMANQRHQYRTTVKHRQKVAT